MGFTKYNHLKLCIRYANALLSVIIFILLAFVVIWHIQKNYEKLWNEAWNDLWKCFVPDTPSYLWPDVVSYGTFLENAGARSQRVSNAGG